MPWGWDVQQQAELSEWFDALDVDKSGAISVEHLRCLLVGMGVDANSAGAMLAAIGHPVDAPLSREVFVRCMVMTSNGGMVSSTVRAAASVDGGGDASEPSSNRGLLDDAHTRLAMLAYRRTRLLADLADPTKRKNFVSRDEFLSAYGPFSLARHDEALAARTPEPPRAGPVQRKVVRTPRLPPPMPMPSPRAPSSLLAPPPTHHVPLPALSHGPESSPATLRLPGGATSARRAAFPAGGQGAAAQVAPHRAEPARAPQVRHLSAALPLPA